jgi:hypothetical protein
MSTHTRSAARMAVLGTACLVFYVELSVALRLLLQQITGRTWFITSLVVPFALVCLFYRAMDQWVRGTPVDVQRETESAPELPADLWEPAPGQRSSIEPGEQASRRLS